MIGTVAFRTFYRGLAIFGYMRDGRTAFEAYPVLFKESLYVVEEFASECSTFFGADEVCCVMGSSC